MKSPFKFLDAYDRQDKEIFFGRAEEIEQLYSLIFQTKLLLVYGQSGTGKTSLIQCGLANRFKPTDWFELFVRRKDNINTSLHLEIRRRAETPIADEAGAPEAIQSLYLDFLRPVYLIFDQFEELFILGSVEEQQAFYRTMAALHKTDLACKAVIVMREEYLAMLYDFEKAVPSLFNKRFRVEPMSLQNVQRVITGTTAAFGIELEKGEATAQQIMDNLSDRRAGVQLSYLQVYLDKLYRKAANAQNGRAQEGQAREGQAGTKTPIIFTERLVQQTGALGDVMVDFLEEQTKAIQEELTAKYHQKTPPEAVQLTLEEFTTLEGTKQPMPRAELSAKLPMSDAIIDDCLAALERSRILRNVEGVYELAHDTLAGRIDERRSVERKNLLKVEKLIDDRYAAFGQTHTLLNKVELNYIEPYLEKLKLRSETAGYVQKSKSTAKRQQMKWIAVTAAIGAIFLVLAIVAFVQKRRVEIIKYYGDNFSAAKQFEEKASQGLQHQEAKEQQKAWLYTLAALGQDLDKEKGLPLSQERLIRQGIAAGIYQQLWSSPGALNEIKHVDFSPDGKRIEIVSVDGIIRFADMATGAELNSLHHHAESVTDSVTAVAFSHDGKWLASASGDTIRLWDVEPDTLIKAAPVDKAVIVHSVAFSPDDKMLASSSKDGAIRLWNLKAPAWLQPLKILPGHGGEVWDIAFSPNGKWLASASEDGAIRLWDVAAGKTISTLTGHQQGIWTVAFSPDGQLLASGSKDGTIHLWDAQTSDPINNCPGHRSEVRKVAFSPDGKWLASASRDSTIRIWDANSGALKHSLHGHTGAIRTLAFSPNTSKGILLLSGSSDHSIRLWEVETGEELAASAGHWDKVNCVAFSPNDSLLASGSHDGTVLLWNRFTGEPLKRLSGHRGVVWSLAFSHDGKLLISGGEDKTVRIWDVSKRIVVDSLKGHTRAVKCVAFDGEDSFIASGSADRTIRLWKRSTEATAGVKFVAATEKFDKDSSSVQSVAFHPKNNLLVSGDSLGMITFRDSQTLKRITRWVGHDKAINSLAFDPAGAKLASASSDDQIRIWSIKVLLDSTKSLPGPWRFVTSRTASYKLTKRSFDKLKIKIPGDVLKSLRGLEGRSFTGEGAFLESVNRSIDDTSAHYQSALLEDAAKEEAQELLVSISGARPKRLNPAILAELNGHEDDVLSVAFNDDGQFLASGSGDATVRIWDVNAASELAVFRGHQDKVCGVAFSPNDSLLASASWDKSIRFWDIQESYKLDVLVNNESDVRDLAFSPTGAYLVSAADDHRLRQWEISKGYAGGLVNRVGGAAALLCVAFTPDEARLAFGAEDDFIRLWDMKSDKISALVGHYGDGLSVAISRDGQYLASGSSDGKIRLWDLSARTQKPLTVDAHKDKVRSVAFSPNGNLLASAGSDNLVHLWQFKEGKLAYWKTYDGHKNGVWGVAFSPDGNTLATGSWDNTVHIWNFRTDRAQRLIGHRGPVLAVAFSPDGSRLASGSWDQTVRLWEVQSGRELDVIRVHTAPVTCVAFDPAGKILASGAKDRTIRLRNLSYLSSFELNNNGTGQEEAAGNASAYLQDLQYLTSDSRFTERAKKYLPFYNIFQAYAYLFAYRLDGNAELVEEPPKFYLQAVDSTFFEAHKFRKLRQPRPLNIGAMKWVYENIPDSLRIARR